MKPIPKIFESKDLNIAYAKGRAEALQDVEKIIEKLSVWNKDITFADRWHLLKAQISQLKNNSSIDETTKKVQRLRKLVDKGKVDLRKYEDMGKPTKSNTEIINSNYACQKIGNELIKVVKPTKRLKNDTK